MYSAVRHYRRGYGYLMLIVAFFPLLGQTHVFKWYIRDLEEFLFLRRGHLRYLYTRINQGSVFCDSKLLGFNE